MKFLDQRGSAKATAILFLTIALLGAGSFVFVRYYSYLFSRRIVGKIIAIDKFTEQLQPDEKDEPARKYFSFAIAIRDAKTQEIFTASSTDRQWAVVEKFQCAEVKLLKYAPWYLDHSGTYFGARLMRLFDCPTDLPLNETPARKAPEAEDTPSVKPAEESSKPTEPNLKPTPSASEVTNPDPALDPKVNKGIKGKQSLDSIKESPPHGPKASPSPEAKKKENTPLLSPSSNRF